MIQDLSPFLLSSGENNGLESGPQKKKQVYNSDAVLTYKT